MVTTSLEKEGLLKMMLFCNLADVEVESRRYHPVAVLKLTATEDFSIDNLSQKQNGRLALLQKEADLNNFKLHISH